MAMPERSTRRILLIILLLAIPLPRVWSGEPAVYESGNARVRLLELYTSEGCSSCPPADQWLAELRHDGRLDKSLIPLAFHVDYWDHLGWKDRFARGLFSERQRQYVRHAYARTAYTPGFFVNGREWRGFFRRRSLPDVAGRQVGSLRLKIDTQQIHARFSPLSRQQRDLYLHVALRGSGLSTRVRQGENAGRRLQHDFTVLDYRRVDMAQREGDFVAALPLFDLRGRETAMLALVGWVTRRDDPTPLQSIAIPLNTASPAQR